MSGSAAPHLVHVSQPTEAGVAVCVRNLTRAARTVGFRVTVASPAGGDLPGWARDEGAEWVPLPMSRAPAVGELALLPALRRLARGADVLHLHSSKAAALGRLAVVGMRRPPLRVVTPHAWSWYVGGRAAPVYRAFERLVLRWTDVVTVVSQHELDEGRAVLGERAERLVLIENGVDTDAYCPDGPRAARDAAPLLVCVGRLSEQKGQDLLLRELAAMQHRDVRLRLVGDGPHRATLVDLGRMLGLADRIEFTGTADPRPHLRAADIVVVPSRWEGMSLLLLEAMACGATIVSTDTGGSDALGAAGVIVALESMPGGMARQLDSLLNDDDRRRTLGEAARRRAIERFDQRQVATAYQDLWQRRCTAHPDRRRTLSGAPDVLVVRPVDGGIAHVARSCAGELRRRGLAVDEVAVDGAGAPAWRALRRVWRLRRTVWGAGTVHVELGRLSTGPFWFAAWSALLRTDLVLAAHDLPHLVNNPGAGIVPAAPGWRDALAYRVAAPLLDRALLRWVRSRTASVVTLSESAADAARAAGFPQVVVADHGADPPVPGPAPSAGHHVLFAGFLGPDKGLDVLREAWASVCTRTELPLRIAGGVSDTHRAWHDRLVADFAGTARPPSWHGSVDDVTFHRLIADAAVVVLPYTGSNPASGVLVRAAVQGRAVIATHVPAFDSVVVDRVSALLVQPGDARALAEALAEALVDAELRDRLGAAAAAMARERFSWASHVDRLTAAYASSMASSPRYPLAFRRHRAS